MPHLHPCPSCSRHVRVDEASCPFCGDALPSSVRESPLPTMPTRRLGRTHLMAFGVAAIAIAASTGCGQSQPEEDPSQMVAVYGGPPEDLPPPPADPNAQQAQPVNPPPPADPNTPANPNAPTNPPVSPPVDPPAGDPPPQ